jgi:hypothetical protein
MPMSIGPLDELKLRWSNVANDSAILHESNKDFISAAVYFLPNRDPRPALIAFLMRSFPTFDRYSDWPIKDFHEIDETNLQS